MCLCVFAGIHLLLSHTCLTLHVAAPANLAVAGQAGEAHGRVITTSAAQTLTAGVFGAGASACTRRVAGGSAEAGGVFQVDQVSSAKALSVAAWARQLCLTGGCVGDTQHSHGGVVAILKQASSVVEGRELLPASPYSTRAGDAVTLASCFQPALHRPNSNVDVVGVNLSPQVLADPLLAEELLEKLGAVFQVVTADPPLPRFSVLDAGGVVTRAPLHPARAACFGECMGQRSRGHRQQEGSLLECSFQEASSAVQAAVPALTPELVATLQQTEAHRFPQRLGQTGLPAAQPLLPPGQSHLLALLQVGLSRRRLVGKRTRQKHQRFPTCQPKVSCSVREKDAECNESQ